MDILFAGNLEPISETFYNLLGHENKLIVCGKSHIKNYHNRSVTPYDYDESQLEHLFQSFSFQTVVYFSKAIDGTKKVFDELENIENIIYLCNNYKVSNLIYVTTNDLADIEKENMDKEKSRYILLHACERLCLNASEEGKLDISVIRVPYLYSFSNVGSQLGKWVNNAVNQKKLSLPGKSATMTDFLWEADFAKLINRMIDEPFGNYIEMNISGGQNISFFEIAELFKKQIPNLSIEYLNYEIGIPKHAENDRARKEYGWFPEGNLEYNIVDMITNQSTERVKKKRKKLLENRPKLKNILVTLIELVLLYVLMDYLEVRMSNNAMLSFMDYRMMFVVILGATRGLNVGIVAALLASINFVVNNLTGTSWQIIFYNTQNWLPFATYFLAGSISGYTRDKNEDAIQFHKEEQDILEKKYIFLNELYSKTLDNKDEFNHQIINYKDSYGKIYAMVKRLASTLPEKIFYEAVNVLEDILENTTVAIYTVDNSDFARLNVCSKPLCSRLSKSLRFTDFQKMKTVLDKHETWINIENIPEYPAYAAPILRDKDIVGIIMVYQVTDHQMCQEYSNKFSIVCGLVQEFMVRAIERDELIAKDHMIPNTRILKSKYFNEILDVKQQMKEKNFSEYVLAKMENQGWSLVELSEKLTSVLRHNDVIGQDDDGDIYILLSQTNAKYLSVIEKRMKEKGLYFKVVSSS